MIRLAPPGTLCQTQAVLERVATTKATTFCEIGPGAGDMSLALCRRGMHGMGVEFSPSAAAIARSTLRGPIERGQYKLVEGDFMAMDSPGSGFDLALSLMVMEHVQDDAEFLDRMVRLVKPGGLVMVCVPARMDRWGVEDDTAGHYRRYERSDLERGMKAAGLVAVEVRSISVPIANLTFHASNFLVLRAGESRKAGLTQREQTESSGIRDIPFKTVFPPPFRFLLNPVSMYPFFVAQRLFYGSSLGLTLLGSGSVPRATIAPHADEGVS